MDELILTLTDTLAVGGVPLRVDVRGRPIGHVWEGWLEFVPAAGDTRRTPRETTQPDRKALEYWATGLSAVYLEGAFARAVTASVEPAPVRSDISSLEPAPFDGPETARGAVLDPFSVGAKGEDLLRRELTALSDWHLRNIVRAYDLDDGGADIEMLPQAELVELIVDSVIPPP